MIVAEPAVYRARTTDAKTNLLTALDRALAEENAPVRSYGPGILALTGLAMKQLFVGSGKKRTGTISKCGGAR